MVATTKAAKQVYPPTRKGHLIERYVASFLQLSGSKDSQDRENYLQAMVIFSEYARRHNFPSISPLPGINNRSKPFTCFEMSEFHSIYDGWFRKLNHNIIVEFRACSKTTQ